MLENKISRQGGGITPPSLGLLGLKPKQEEPASGSVTQLKTAEEMMPSTVNL